MTCPPVGGSRIRTLTLTLTLLAALWFSGSARAHQGVPGAVDREIHYAAQKYGVSYWEMRAVSFCESRWNPRAVGSGSYGLFQFIRSTWAATPYGRQDIFSAHWNALAAAWLVHMNGSWRQWTCKPW